MKMCPICNETVKDVDRACQCGELLQPWRTIEFYGTTLRQRGLSLSGEGNYLGACLSFLEAVISNPLDSLCALDAVRSLTHLERFDDATLLLKAVANRVNKDDAEALAAAISDRVKQRNTATESVAADAEDAAELPRAVRPLLALPCIPRRRSIVAKLFRDKTAETLWEVVVRAEKRCEGDRSALHGWAEIVGENDFAGGVFHYVQGLGNFQDGDDDAAVESFSRCLQCDPPYMNPAAYLLYTCLGHTDRVGQVVQLLIGRHDQMDLGTTVDCMMTELHDRLDEDQAKELRMIVQSRRQPRAVSVSKEKQVKDGLGDQTDV